MAQTLTPVVWSVASISVRGLTIPVARVAVELFIDKIRPELDTGTETAWLDTGAPLSVVPYHIHHQRLLWRPIPGIQVTWAGQPCDLGRMDVWLPTDQPPQLRGPLSLLAKFPRGSPPGIRVPILLGLEFLLANQAELALPPPPGQGALLLP